MRLARDYPEFGAMCQNAGLVPGAGEAPFMPEEMPDGPSTGVASAAMGGGGPPVHMITVQPGSKLTTKGLPPTSFALSYGGKENKNFFSNSTAILSELLEDVNRLVTFID